MGKTNIQEISKHFSTLSKKTLWVNNTSHMLRIDKKVRTFFPGFHHKPNSKLSLSYFKNSLFLFFQIKKKTVKKMYFYVHVLWH